MKSKKSKLALNLLFSLSALTVVSAPFFLNLVQDKNQNNNTTIQPLDLNNDLNKNRAITDNTIPGDNNIKNPDEVFYLTKDLKTLDVWTAGNGGAVGSENKTNKAQFDNLAANIEAIQGESDAKSNLAEIKKDVDKYLKFKKIESKWQSDNDLNSAVPWKQVKESIKQNLENPAEEFTEIQSIEEESLKRNLLQLSGITEEESPATSIGILTGKPTTKKNDLLTQAQKPFANPNPKAGVTDVAGTNYNTLIKVAEINLDNQDNYVLEYSYRENATAPDAESYLIIKNDNGQIKDAANLKEAYQKLDIFGRYDTLVPGNTMGSSSFKNEQENIVLKKNDEDKLEVLVRLKDDEIITKMNFSSGTPDKFGILDVQADENNTFKSLIESKGQTGGGAGGTTTGGKKLMDPAGSTTNTENQLVKIQFFTSEFISKPMAKPFSTKEAVTGAPNRTLEIYQGYEEDYTFSMDLNYITRFATDNSGNDYEPIKQYVAGVATSKVESLDLKFDGTNGSTVNDGKETYNFFDLLKQNMAPEVKDAFPNISTIKVNSSVKNGVAKQTITYSDQFYLIGNPASRVGVNTKQDIKIKMPNMLDKIFVEKPIIYDQTLPPKPPFKQKHSAAAQSAIKTGPNVDSQLKATDQVDEKVNVIRTLGQVYGKWAAKNSSSVNNTKHNLTVSKIKFVQNGSTFQDINIVREAITKTGPELYSELNQYWPGVANLIQTIFNPEFTNNEKRFEVGTNNSAQNIIDKFFVNNFDFIPNYSQVDELLAEGIRIWNEDSFFTDTSHAGQIPTLDQLSADSQIKFSQLLAKLVEIQFDAIIKEFESNQMYPLYKEFSSALNSDQTAERLKLIDVNSLLNQSTVDNGNGPNLIKYQQDAWDNITEKQTITVKEQFLSLIKLLAFGKTDDDLTNLADAILTNPLVALKFKEFEPENFVVFDDNLSINVKMNQMRILDGILSYFGYSFSDSYIDFINKPTPGGVLKLVFKLNGKTTDLNFSQVLEDIINKLSQKGNEYKPTANESYSSYWLDNIIAGTNVIRSMNWKLKQLNQLVPVFKATNQPTNREEQQWQAQEVIAKINDILAQQQASPAEQAAWYSAITDGSKDFATFASGFSGRTSDDLDGIFTELTKDNVIMTRTTISYNDSLLAPLAEGLKYLWFIIVALVGVGIMSSSIVGIVNQAKREKLGAHPVIKWLLFSLIGLGALVAVLALTFGIPAVLV